VTPEALFGLLALNLLYFLAGACLVGWVRGWDGWSDVARLAGLAYLVGVAATGVVWTVLLIIGVPFSGWLVIGVPLALVGVGVAAGRSRGRRLEVAHLAVGSSPLVWSAVGVALAGLFLEGLFRRARLAGLYWWDAWSFWIPKAKAVYVLGGLDEQFFTILPGAAYPPLVPILDAAAFSAMGEADVITLHVQYWFFAVGFVWALAGLLAERAPAWILWPFVLALLVAPRIGKRFVIPEAALLLDSFFVLAAVLVAYWLTAREPWQLPIATVLLCSIVLTKREGTLLVAALLVAALVAAARRWRSDWRPLAFSALAAVLCGASWRIWYVAHGISGEGPTGGGLDPTVDTDRLWPSLRLAVTVFFDNQYWSVVTSVGLGALLVATLARVATSPLFFGTLIALVVVGGAWITWAIPELPITAELGANPIVRYMGSAALVAAAASPILLAAAWQRVAGPSGDET
jgi:hypothetical protein